MATADDETKRLVSRGEYEEYLSLKAGKGVVDAKLKAILNRVMAIPRLDTQLKNELMVLMGGPLSYLTEARNELAAVRGRLQQYEEREVGLKQQIEQLRHSEDARSAQLEDRIHELEEELAEFQRVHHYNEAKTELTEKLLGWRRLRGSRPFISDEELEAMHELAQAIDRCATEAANGEDDDDDD